MLIFIGAIILSWLTGSIPFAYIVYKVIRNADIRTLGSGNAGATNIFRFLGLKWALVVFVLDFLKGWLPVFVILYTGLVLPVPKVIAGIAVGSAAFLGHLFPVFTGFKGGKGMAAGAGVMTALYPLLFPACLTVFLLVLALSRRVSLASIVTALLLPLLYSGIVYIRGEELSLMLVFFTCLLPVALIMKHRKNIYRLCIGKEKAIF